MYIQYPLPRWLDSVTITSIGIESTPEDDKVVVEMVEDIKLKKHVATKRAQMSETTHEVTPVYVY